MKRRKTAFILVFIMLLSSMIQIAYATSEISIPTHDDYISYAMYDELRESQENPIVIYVDEEEFPITVTVMDGGVVDKTYTLDNYGVNEIKMSIAMTEYAIFIRTPFGVEMFAPTKPVYSTIIILKPDENPNADHEEIQEPAKEPDLALKSESDVNDAYVSEPDVEIVPSLALESESDVNIDYIGELDVVVGPSFTLAIDYSQGIIEKWRLLVKEDTWNISLEGERVEHVTEDEKQVMVVTVDNEGAKHLIVLCPNGEVRERT